MKQEVRLARTSKRGRIQTVKTMGKNLLTSLCLMALCGACSLHSQQADAPQSVKNQDARLFSASEIEPQGNSVLHYIDSRLHKLRSQDAEALTSLSEAVEADPQSSYLHMELARHLAEGQQFNQADLEVEKAVSIDPKNPEAHLLKGKLYSVRKQSLEALEEYEKCIQLQPDLEECYTMAAREYILQENPPGAIAILQRLLTRDPSSIQGLFYLATLYAEKPETESKSIPYFEKLLDEDPDHFNSLMALARIAMDREKYDQALQYFLRMEELAPQDISTKLRIGLLYYEQENYPEAIRRFSKIMEMNPDNDRVAYYLGILEAQNKNYPEAIRLFKRVPTDSSLYKDAVVRLALVYQETQKISEAVAATQEALKKRKDIPELFELLGTLYAKQELYNKALLTYDKGLKSFPRNEKLLFAKGVLLDQMGRFEDSMAIMEEILMINSENALALNYVGYSYVDRGLKLQEALTMLQKANQLKPDDGYILDSLGWAYFKLGQVQQARDLVERANQLNPKEPAILEHLGDIYLKLGQIDKAKNYFQQALGTTIQVPNLANKELEDQKRIRAKLSNLNLPDVPEL